MKNKLILLVLMGTMFSFTACEENMDSYDFSDSMPAYVELKSKAAISVEEGSSANITFQSREAFQQEKTLQYKVTGAYNTTGSVVLPRNSTSVVLSLAIPEGTVPAGAETAVATLALTDADGLSVGRNGVDKEKVTIEITAAE